MRVRKSLERGHFVNHWLESYHSFSFSEYFDPNHMGFHDLRVINEDFVQPGMGFPTHGHRDMEIITYVTEGAVAHKDSMGNTETLNAGEVQVMSAGKGVMHSEFNPHADRRLKLLQIWILPSRKGIAPSYAQKLFPRAEKINRLRLIAAPEAVDGALKIHQDVKLYASILEAGQSLAHTLDSGRAAWIQVVEGPIQVNGVPLEPGDAIAVEESGRIQIDSAHGGEFLLFDLVDRGSKAL